MKTRIQTEEYDKKRKDIVRTFIVGLGTLLFFTFPFGLCPLKRALCVDYFYIVR